MPRSRDEKFAYEFCSAARVEFVSQIPCCVCGRGPCENHHIISDGISRKAKYIWIVPLCRGCHGRWHWIGKLSLLQWVSRTHGALLWNGRRDIESWEEIAGLTEAAWRDHEFGLAY